MSHNTATVPDMTSTPIRLMPYEIGAILAMCTEEECHAPSGSIYTYRNSIGQCVYAYHAGQAQWYAIHDAPHYAMTITSRYPA